ncbi:MAG: class I SAM-dependent methyltransferase [Proteobacteria bacterium]|nr:class I SAM-dependent methyltransferase [Pseudomonadota bacterium]MBU1389506.1 class I SAM-dependent methyltransferase [Pseudomonadota bacterium]MBU1541326.1 class I SAM-dependent methyltransferase [Pseudomonadota bacterium]MBU2431076.1 class I SAM-dependent methyltransferase [Pseudomonadota bacterium]MBU2480563.1 class I SAM-dependent methyltransferase [Pseudomonadota bacterium]
MSKKPILRFLLFTALNIHNYSYRAVGKLSPKIETDGLHPKHRLMKYHDWFIARIQKNWDVLDIGCGSGALAFDMRPYCKSVTAVDIVKKNIVKAKKTYAADGINYICADAVQYDFEKKFNVIVLSNVLEHIENRVEFLKKIFVNQDKNTPPVLLLRVPMITRDWISLYKKELGVEWRLDRTHHIEYTLEQIFDEMAQAGLEVKEYNIQFGEFYGVIISNKQT